MGLRVFAYQFAVDGPQATRLATDADHNEVLHCVKFNEDKVLQWRVSSVTASLAQGHLEIQVNSMLQVRLSGC